MAVLALSWMTPAKLVRQAEHLAQPLHDHVLDLGAGRARLPAHALGAQAGRDQVGQHRRKVRVGGEVGEPSGVVPVGDARQHDAVELVGDVVQTESLLRRLVGQQRLDLARCDPTHDGQLGDVLAVIGDPVDELMAQAAEFGGVHRALSSQWERRARPARRAVEVHSYSTAL